MIYLNPVLVVYFLCVWVRRGQYRVWGHSAPSLCLSPAGRTGASTLSPTLPTLIYSERTINHRFLKTFLSRPLISTWGQRTSGESGPTAHAITSWCPSDQTHICPHMSSHLNGNFLYPPLWFSKFNFSQIFQDASAQCCDIVGTNIPSSEYWMQSQTKFERHSHNERVWLKAVEGGCETQRAVWLTGWWTPPEGRRRRLPATC